MYERFFFFFFFLVSKEECLGFVFNPNPRLTSTHSSVLPWRIPGTGEPGGLPSLGSHRVRHDWSDLAAAAGSQETNSSVPLSRQNSFSIPKCQRHARVVCPWVNVWVCVCMRTLPYLCVFCFNVSDQQMRPQEHSGSNWPCGATLCENGLPLSSLLDPCWGKRLKLRFQGALHGNPL